MFNLKLSAVYEGQKKCVYNQFDSTYNLKSFFLSNLQCRDENSKTRIGTEVGIIDKQYKQSHVRYLVINVLFTLLFACRMRNILIFYQLIVL